MLKQIYHVGLTVSDLDKSVAFYRDVLGLKYQGEILMEGPETDAMFARENCKIRVAYLNGSDDVMAPPVELICFVDSEAEKDMGDLHKTSISELCFYVEDIYAVYEKLVENNVVCLSAPQSFDFTKDGFGKSKALYLRDPDGIVLELMMPVND